MTYAVYRLLAPTAFFFLLRCLGSFFALRFLLPPSSLALGASLLAFGSPVKEVILLQVLAGSLTACVRTLSCQGNIVMPESCPCNLRHSQGRHNELTRSGNRIYNLQGDKGQLQVTLHPALSSSIDASQRIVGAPADGGKLQ